MSYLYLVLAILCETVATTCLKVSDGFTKTWASVVVVMGYGAAFYLLSLTLRGMKVGTAYAIWSAVGIVLITIAGFVFFKQKIDLAGLIGMGLIIAGVVVLMGFSKAAIE